MAKKKKTAAPKIEEQKDIVAVTTETPTTEVDEELVIDPIMPAAQEIEIELPQIDEKATEAVVQLETKYLIEEAAHQLIDGYKEHWLPGIKVRCTLMGMSQLEEYSLETWKNLFIAWGGSGILKK